MDEGVALASSLKLFADHIASRVTQIVADRGRCDTTSKAELRGSRVWSSPRRNTSTRRTEDLYRHDDAIQGIAKETHEAKDLAGRAHDRTSQVEELIKNMQSCAVASAVAHHHYERPQGPGVAGPAAAQREGRHDQSETRYWQPQHLAPRLPGTWGQEPSGTRLLAWVGNLGWGTESSLLCERAQALLTAAVAAEDMTALTPITEGTTWAAAQRR